MNNPKVKLSKQFIYNCIRKKRERIKCLGINLTKQEQSIYSENYKTPLKEIKELNSWKNTCSWIRRHNINDDTIPQISLLIQVISVRAPDDFFVKIGKLILKFILNCKRHRIVKTIWKKNEARRLTLPNFRIYSKAVAIKMVSYWHKYRHKDLQSRIES